MLSPISLINCVALGAAAAAAGATATQGFSLSVQRVVLANVAFEGQGAAGVPRLWPAGMYRAPGSSLEMTDVRMLVSDATLQQQLQFFRDASGGINVRTDGRSFLHIPEYADKSTTLRSVTLISGPCGAEAADIFLQPSASAAAVPAAPPGGCNVRTVSNATLVPTLLRDAGVFTDQPLIVFIIANVSLGQGLHAGSIDIRRPTLMTGLWSVPTSVDLGMVVNQLNVTAPNAKVFWQSLYLENAAPGDAVSSIVATPYSAAVSANIWAMYCNRSLNCLNLHNTSTYLASENELSYLTFMYSMFNSPLPNMRQHTDFYHTELKVTVLDMGPGPNGQGMTLHNMSTSAWELVGAVYTTQPAVVIAPRLPFPPGAPMIRQSTQAAPWVEAVDSCASMQAALQAPSEETRLHVWMLLNNVTTAEADCWQKRDMCYTTQIYGQIQDYMNVSLGSETQAAAGKAAAAAAMHTSGNGFNVFSLSFGFMRDVLVLPPQAADKFLQIQNVTLLQLPQGPGARAAAGMNAGQGGDGPTPPDVWTLLLWSVNRTSEEGAVFLGDVQLLLPQPEWDFVANTAQGASSFVVQLAGSVGLAFTSATVEGNAVRVASLQGPGIVGSNVWLLPDPTAAAAMPEPYVWPLSVSAAPSSGRLGGGSDSRSAMIGAAVGASVGGALLLLLGACCWCWLVRRRQRLAGMYALPAATLGGGKGDAGAALGGVPGRRSGSGKSGSAYGLEPGDGAGQCVAVELGHVGESDTQGAPDSTGHLPVALVVKQGLPGQQGSSEQSGGLHTADAPLSDGPSSLASGSRSASGSGDPNLNTVVTGLQRWRTAISNTTMQVMERRMHSVHSTPPLGSSATSSSRLTTLSGATSAALVQGTAGPQSAAEAAAAAAAAGRQMQQAAADAAAMPSLQLLGLLGQGSFGSVYMGIWHGKRVAVKVMQLPASALLGTAQEDQQQQQQQQQANGLSPDDQQRRRRTQQLQPNSPPHMAIMETVVSTQLSHPNVVQVFTYMLNPLTVDEAAAAAAAAAESGVAAPQQQQQQQPQGAPAAGGNRSISGWELRLVMEYCDQGTLREALDQKCFLRNSSNGYLAPTISLSLAHDIAAALLHLHSEGVVHGDLKAANVLLTRGGEDCGGLWAACLGFRVTAKVADFGLALQLDPSDTHATMAARGTPTHMSPELFLSGHVSKASDVYAFGILLFEMLTGQRAYAGVPIPLLPHEVARQGLRPAWPANLPPGCRDLQRLAEACWAQQPQDRPSLMEVFHFLECCQTGKPTPLLRNELLRLSQEQQPEQQQQQQQGQPLERCVERVGAGQCKRSQMMLH
ncbi:hypothetical protein OEZ85_001840 [Tetradesmus obliquus]|uniref:Protein kinase domain-containing protein n=1 Tax=Tetradesmus obliquus TaxID=3088 RepID=A0ABY8U221_TETOB|nr:hypothetical protein OEZ85_001840 [Tetradesmus obliquus]